MVLDHPAKFCGWTCPTLSLPTQGVRVNTPQIATGQLIKRATPWLAVHKAKELDLVGGARLISKLHKFGSASCLF